MSYSEKLLEDARLVVLKELEAQPDGRLNEKLLQAALDAFGHRHDRAWLRALLTGMEAMGAVKNETVTMDGFMVAAITRDGVEHLERRDFITGIAQPSKGV